jgi:hypothetical protein
VNYECCRGAVGAKANVLQGIGFVRLVAALLILPKGWLFFRHISVVRFLHCRLLE